MSWVIITGDSRGLGQTLVKTILNKTKFNVIGISRSENASMTDLQNQFTDRYHHLNFDLSKSDAIKDLYTSQIKPIGPIAGLINNAAAAYDDIVSNLNLEHLQKMYQINVFTPMMLSKYAIRDMLLNQIKGSIVHITSISAHTGYKGLAMYGSTKGALESFSKGVAREWGEKGIRSNCVAPGFMTTQMTSGLSENALKSIYNRTSLKKGADLESVAETTRFLLSDESSSITGEVIRVDCGAL